MPVNLESLRADPEFQRLSPQEQQQLLQAAGGAPCAHAPGCLTRPTLARAHQSPDPQDRSRISGPQCPRTGPTDAARAGTVPDEPGRGPARATTRPALNGRVYEALDDDSLADGLWHSGPCGHGPASASRKSHWKAPRHGFGRFVHPIVEGVSQTLGFGTGRTIETGQLPSPGELATELAVTAGTGRILEGIGAIGADLLRRSKGGQAIINADKLTQEAHAKWQADTQAAEEAAKSQQKELYDTAVIKAKTSQREYEMATRQRQQTIAANQQDYDEARAGTTGR